MASDSRVYAFEEVAKHNKTNDCWIIINGKVYDVSIFMEEHPGGAEVILSSTGKDSTNDFDDVGHSDDAREMLGKYVIGALKMEEIPLKAAYSTPQHAQPKAAAYDPDKTTDFIIKILQFLGVLFTLALAFAVRQYTNPKDN